jgi:hypothetical protein
MTEPSGDVAAWISEQLNDYRLLDALRERRSRRFGRGMHIPGGFFAYESQQAPQPLTLHEEAALAFAACGLTGYALADLDYSPGAGGRMQADLFGRTAASPDSISAVSVIVINDSATYLVRRPQDIPYEDIPQLLQYTRAGDFVSLYQAMRVKLTDQRVTLPRKPGYSLNLNRWSAHAEGSTCFLPVNDITAIYINTLLEYFTPEMGLFVRDEQNGFRPAGLASHARSGGGHLWDDPRDNRVVTVSELEASLVESVAVEQGMILQNLGLMTEALGLGGFVSYARNESGWLEALGFRMQEGWSSRYTGAGRWKRLWWRFLRRDFKRSYAVGLETDDSEQPLLSIYAPPYQPDMDAAVRAWIASKYGPQGSFRAGAAVSAWKNSEEVARGIRPPGDRAIQATIDYCTYILERYGRFPAHYTPLRTISGYQVAHLDADFYATFFRADNDAANERRHPPIEKTNGTS